MSASNNSITDDGEVTIIGPSSHIKHVFEDDEEDLILQSVYHSPLDDEVWVANKSEAQALSRYDDFQTIDWCKDRVRDRLRFRQVKKKKVRGTVSDKIKGAHDAWSGWLVVFLVGIVAGFSAGCVDIGSGWLSDIKEGVCTGQFWFNRESCCWASTTKFGEESCQEWKPWSDLLGVSSHSAAYFINYVLYILWALLFAGVTVVLVRALAPYASGSGIPEIKTILGGFIIHGYLGWWTYVVKTFTLVTSVATGLSLGKEGPFVHVGCCIGNVMVRLFPKYYGNEAKKREVLSAAAAAGVAVAFGAPIGGVLFSLEEVSYYFPMKTLWRTFFCALIASLTLGYMNPYGNGRLVQLYVDSSYPWQLFELAPFVFLGVLGGLYGAFFAKCNIYWCRIRKTTWLGKHPIKEVLFVTLLSSVLAYPNEFTRDQASRVMLNLFQNCGPEDGSPLCDYNYNITATQHVSTDIYPHRSAGPGVYEALWKLFLAFLFKGLITVITFGLKIPAGLFIPSMVIGACSGRIVGIGMEELVTRHRDFWLWKEFCSQSQNHCVLPGLYSMIGAAAFLGGVTRITVSLVVIMFEVTGGFTYIVPLMVGILTSKWVGDALIEGIYEGHIHLNGYPYLDPKVDFNHTTLAVDVMKPRRTDPPLTCIPKTGFTIGDLESLLSDVTFTGFPVIVDRESHFIAGFVTRRDIKVALHHARLRDETLVSASRVYFSKRLPPRAESPIPSLSLRHILDTSPITVTGGTPMEIVVDMFRKLGLRQVLITHNGRLLGIITKKDVLRHIAELSNMDPDSILFN